MKIRRMTHRLKLILLSIFTSLLFLFFVIILFLKLSNPYKVSIYNYESYLNKDIINKVKKDYSYHVFTNLDEFTRAIKNKKAVAGVSSDYQIARLILENKLKKINFQKAFNITYNDNNKKEIIMNLYTKEVKKQFDFYDNWIIEEIKKINPENTIYENKFKPYIYYNDKKEILGFEVDGENGIDSFYEFLIPYFTLDKMIVYNTENFEIFKNKRNNVVSSANFDEIKNGMEWYNIIKSLVQKYKNPRIYWTNWFLDNAMIGQFYKYYLNDNTQRDLNGNWKLLDKTNYEDIFDHFNKFVLDATGASIKDINRNKLVTDGQELVSSIIEPINGKADIAIMYNGDVLDAYYGKDNFASLEESNNISFVRPKYSYTNIDAWIISKDTNNFESDKLLSRLNKYIFSDVIKNENDLNREYIQNVYQEIKENSGLDQNTIKHNLFRNENETKSLDEIDANFYKENYDFFKNAFAYENLPNINNFDVINYTPSYKNIKNFLKDWYFLDKNKNPDLKAISIFDLETASNVEFRPYQPLDLELKTKMIDYYYQKTKS